LLLKSSLIKNILNGYNNTVIVYGPVNTGKTYTLFGDDKQYGLGLIPRVIKSLYEDTID